MRNLIKKIKSNSGETFIELIIAILIVAFGCMLIGTLYTSSLNMNITAKNKDDAYYSDLNDMTASDKSYGEGKITITDDEGDFITVDVDVYGSDDLTSYRKQNKG